MKYHIIFKILKLNADIWLKIFVMYFYTVNKRNLRREFGHLISQRGLYGWTYFRALTVIEHFLTLNYKVDLPRLILYHDNSDTSKNIPDYHLFIEYILYQLSISHA